MTLFCFLGAAVIYLAIVGLAVALIGRAASRAIAYPLIGALLR